MRADAIQGTQLVDSHLNRKSRKCTRPSSSQTTSTQKNLILFPKSSEPLGVEAASTDRDPTTQSVGGAYHCGGSSREYRTGGGASSGSTITRSDTERHAEGRETNMISPRDPLRGARNRRVDGRVDGTGGGGVQVGAEESELQTLETKAWSTPPPQSDCLATRTPPQTHDNTQRRVASLLLGSHGDRRWKRYRECQTGWLTFQGARLPYPQS